MRLKKKQSSIESWDNLWNAYDRKRYEYQLALEEKQVRWQRIQQIVLEKNGSFNGLNCIEIGAGSGHYSMLFAKRGARVTIIDYSENALKFCMSMFEEQGIATKQVDFILMDALKLDDSLFGKFDISMSFGVAEHFQGEDRKLIVKNHFKVLKDNGVTFISVPNNSCIPLTTYLFLMKFIRQNTIEAYPFTRREFINIIKELNIEEYSFIGSSIYETFNFMCFYQRKKGIIKDITSLKKERGTILDQYMGRELTLVATRDVKVD